MASPHRCLRADALIFDLDGTLWDTTAACAEAWNRVLAELGVERRPVTHDDVRAVTGQPHRDAVANALPDLEGALLERFSERTMVEDNRVIAERGGELYTGVRDAIPELARRFRLMIVSNCQAGYIEVFRATSGLDGCFVDHECWGNTGDTKANNLRAVIARNAVRAPVFVGDTEGDRVAARDNGVPFVFASYGFGRVRDAEATLARFDELGALVSPLP
jgi:phosphoglycolate phosphatase